MNKKYNTEEERKKAYNERFKRYKAKKKAEIKQKNAEKYRNNIEFRAHSLSNSYKAYDKYHFYSSKEETITDIELIELFKNGCIYCGEKDWHKLGADRIDNKRPHSKTNCVCSCGRCNVERSKKDFQDFYNQKFMETILE